MRNVLVHMFFSNLFIGSAEENMNFDSEHSYTENA